MSCFDNTHSWKMRCTYHIGKRRIFVCRRDCRSASVLRHWDSVLFFAYPMGGVNLLILINFQKLLVVCRNACSNAERKFFVAPPPMSSVCCQRNTLHQGDTELYSKGCSSRLLAFSTYVSYFFIHYYLRHNVVTASAYTS